MDFWVIGRTAFGWNVWIDRSDCPVDIRYLVGVGRQDSYTPTTVRQGFHKWDEALAYACSMVGR